jgi:hypothetical protein
MQIISVKEYSLIDCLQEVSRNYLDQDREIDGLSKLLKRLILQLNEVSQTYRDSLFACWGNIEIEYAVMLSENRKELSESEKNIVNASITNLLDLCSGIKREYKIEENPYAWPSDEQLKVWNNKTDEK